MRRLIVVGGLVAGGFAFVSDPVIKYPVAKKIENSTNYFGVAVADPYRWLELDGTPETNTWIKQENQTTEDYLNTISFRGGIQNQLQSFINHPTYSSPLKVNGVYYFFKNEGIQTSAVFYAQKDLKSEPEVFIDPGKPGGKGNVMIDNVIFSKKGKYVAFSTKKPGSDWQTAYVMDVATKQLLPGKTEWIKLSTLQWQGDEGYYYSRYPEPAGNDHFSNQIRNHSVYFHKLGDPQSSDRLVYEDKEHPYRFHYAQVTEDDRYLMIYSTEGSTGSQLMVRDLYKGNNAPFKTILEGFNYEVKVIDSEKKILYAITNVSAPRNRIVMIDLDNPYVNNWETVIPESKDVLQAVSPAGGNWFVTFQRDASNLMSEYTMGGYKLRDIALPPYSTVITGNGRLNDTEFLYGFSNFTQPLQLYRLNILTGKSEIFKGSEPVYSPVDFETKQVFVNSEDGTRIPMFLTYKKGLQLNGQNPVLMTAFGGMKVSETPGYDVANLLFMQQGGIYAVVNTRGGLEYGDKWHKAATGIDKQNAFDDFIAAVKYLQDEKYTNPSKTAIQGSTHGGLLVAVSMVQHPELFEVAMPDAALTDMLRYHKFTTAYGWEGEYGISDDREAFDNLYSYSPIHNLKPGVKYPAIFITTSIRDDKVVPAHSYKFAAALQEFQTGINPVLLRISEDDDTKSIPRGIVDKQTDRMAFLMYNLGMKI